MIPLPHLPPPSTEYEAAVFSLWSRALLQHFRALQTPGPLRGTTLNLSNLPTAAAGLASGDVWVDAAAGNVLKVVP